MKTPTQFDAAYFKRFYFDRDTKVVTREEMHARAGLIAAILRQAQLPIRSILDAGCGIGMLKPAFARVLKRSRTDRAVTMRPAAWYRARLRRKFYYLGFGVWIRRTRATVRWALES